MPINKNMLGRLLVIHGKLSTRRSYSWSQLADACELSPLVGTRPSKRSIQNDIAYLQREFNAPIPKGQSAYRYEKPFSFLTVLDVDDVGLLSEAVALLKQFKALPQSEGLEEVLLKLENKAGVAAEEMPNVVFFEQVPQLRGINYLNELYNYIRAERCVEVSYRDFKQQYYQFVIHPSFLKEYNNRWYLYGREEQTQEIMNLPLDRIEGLSASDITYRRWDNFDPEEWFDEMIGVTRLPEQKPEQIVLRVRKPRAYYVLTKPLHPHQIVEKETESSIVFSYRLLVNKELEAKILELGADVEVLEPAALRNNIAEIARQMAAVHTCERIITK